MPKYDYKCNKCQEITEDTFSIADGPLPAIICKCGGEAFRVFTAVPAQFKGTGWGGK